MLSRRLAFQYTLGYTANRKTLILGIHEKNSFLLIGGSSEGVEMLLPVGRIDGCVLNGVAAVDHDAITNVDADVRHAGGVIRPNEKDEITGLCIRL